MRGCANDGGANIKHVLLISIDGMHALDFINCASNGNLPESRRSEGDRRQLPRGLDVEAVRLLSGIDGHRERRIAAHRGRLLRRGVRSGPGSADRYTTGNGLAGGACTPNAPNGTGTEYEEGIDIDQTQLNGGAPGAAYEGGIASIDPTKLVRDPYNACQPVWPWNFVRTNTIFGVIHQAGGYVAWSDKHPAYSSVAGNSYVAGPAGSILDDYYSPEINSTPIPLPVTLPNGTPCNPLPDQAAATASGADYTTSFQNVQCYDQLKANAILNQINGLKHNGSAKAPVPNLFGMNFQAVSVGQKLIEKTFNPPLKGGYVDNVGTPSAPLASAIKFVDASIGQMISALKSTGDYNSTLIVITAKHGQSPVDSLALSGDRRSLGKPDLDVAGHHSYQLSHSLAVKCSNRTDRG